MATHSIRVSDDLLAAARQEARVMSRSLTGQAEHWMKLGRALERSPSFNYDRLHDTLQGRRSPDDMTADESEVYDVLFGESMWHASAAGEADAAYYAHMTAKAKEAGFDPAELGDLNAPTE